MGPLDDVKVLDLGRHISGPWCAKQLADYGARVIKVEPPGTGDPARRMGPFPDDIPHLEKSGLFLHVNSGKQSVTLDIASHEGAGILKELAQWADVLVENLSPTYLSSFGLGYEELESLNPRLVMTSISPFGATGPYRDYLATEIGVFAMGGRMHAHGLPDREPLRYAPDISWFQAGATAAVATMGALFVSRFQDVGQHVDISAAEAQVGNVDNRPLHYAYSGVDSARNYTPGGFPLGAYPCADGYVVFGVVYDLFFRRLCQAMEMTDLLEDPRFATPDARAEHVDILEPILLEWTTQRTKREIFDVCQRYRVLCSPIFSPEDLREDPQLRARDYFVELDHPEAGRLTYPGLPIRMSGSPGKVAGPAPTLGQHNIEVFCELLGHPKEELSFLRYEGAI